MKLRKLKRKSIKSLQKNKNSAALQEERLQIALNFLQTGKLDQAEKIYRIIINNDAGHNLSRHMMGIIAHRKGHLEKAAGLMEDSVAADPNQPGYQNNLGLVYIDLGKKEEALACFDHALAQMPDFFEAITNKGNVLRALKRHEEALSCYEQAKRLNPTESKLYCNIGNILYDLGRFDEAVEHLQKALKLNPAHADAQYSLGKTYKKMGQDKEAEEFYEKTVEQEPAHASAYYSLALSRKFTPADHELIATGESMLEQSGLDDDQRVRFHFALGKIYDDCTEYDKAFAHFQKGNGIAHKKRNFNIEEHHRFIDEIMAAFPGSTPPAGFGSSSEMPVFIVGMPRSGTSLVEQIIARHSKVHGAGELTTLDDLIQELEKQPEKPWTFPEDYPGTDEKLISSMSEKYLAHIQDLSEPNAMRVTDKMPYNYLYIGLIAQIFPKARIIHCCRNSLDTCLSIYFQHFSIGNKFSFDLQETASAYKEYYRLMAHWQRTDPIPMLEVRYEELIGNLEDKVRELTDFCGLDWEEECLTFHKSRRRVDTSSSWQVKQPIYTTSKNRWKNYEKFIGPLREALGDLAE